MEELEKQPSVILEKALTVAEKTGDFVIEQAPLLLQEFYNWHLAKASLGIFLGVIFFIVGFVIVKISGSKEEIKEYGSVCNKFLGRYYSMDRGFIASIFGSVLFVTSMCLICVNIYKISFIVLAPKLYLIEYFIK